jgi:hypothetical protein
LSLRLWSCPEVHGSEGLNTRLARKWFPVGLFDLGSSRQQL